MRTFYDQDETKREKEKDHQGIRTSLRYKFSRVLIFSGKKTHFP